MKTTQRKKGSMLKEIREEPELDIERLRKLMEQRNNMTAAQLAEYSGVSYNLLYKLLRGDERPNITAAVVAKLAQYFGCSVDYLMGITDNPLPMRNGLSEFLEQLALTIESLSPQRRDDLTRIIAALKDADNSEREQAMQRIRLNKALLNSFYQQFGKESFNVLLDALLLNHTIRPSDIDTLFSEPGLFEEGGDDE